jgi:hypothetical protein
LSFAQPVASMTITMAATATKTRMIGMVLGRTRVQARLAAGLPALGGAVAIAAA